MKPTNTLVASPFSAGGSSPSRWGLCPRPRAQGDLELLNLPLKFGQRPFRFTRLVAFVLRYVGARTALTLWSNCAKTRSADSAKSSRGVALVIGAMICATDLGKCSSHKPRRTFSDTLCFSQLVPHISEKLGWRFVASSDVPQYLLDHIFLERPVRLRIASFK
ncbi:unnamed protein product [Acanthosepion pharaonis]|uniref:Uncharacterized protein n=1 Tax=Acanthosepion pharaonis TaxID=158019 RepID=A0A812DZR5_ACAPH|nr:unnamed protein product [Sepia pharaonis]